MKDFEWTAEVDPAINQACGTFLVQIRALMAVDGVAVVLMEQDQSASRVVFSWEAFEKSSPLTEPSGLYATPRTPPPACITLKGSGGTVGAVLIRGTPFGSLGSVAVDLVQKPAQHLAVLLENILLQHRLERSGQEKAALDRIGEMVRSQAPVEGVYRHFAEELIGLIDYQRLSVFLASRNSETLTCVYRTRSGLRSDELPVTRSLPGTGCELVFSGCRSYIVPDLRAYSDPAWPELSGDVGFRSAVIVPIVHGGDAVGVVALENRLPRAYCQSDEQLLLRAAALLEPAMANLHKTSQPAGRDEQAAAFNRLAQILASNRRLDEVFDDYAVAAAELIEFDRMTLAWLEPNGCSIFTLMACPSAAVPQATTESDFVTNIRSKLQFGQHDIGTLTLWRRRVRAFTPEDAAILERLGSQVSAKVQYHRLYHLAKHQACQLGQLQQTSTSVGQAGGEADPSNEISEITSRPDSGQALPILESGRQLDSLGQELLVDAAHALRSPLSSIKGYSSTLLLSDVFWPPEVRQEFLETIDREADHLTGAINDLLGSMESESGTVHLDSGLVPVKSLLCMAAAELVGDDGGPTRFQCQNGLPPVTVDQTLMVQAIAYLASCAHRADSSGAALAVRAHRMEERVRITIGPAHAQADVGGWLEVLPPQTNSEGSVASTWVHEELMLSVCHSVLRAHGVELRQGAPGTREEMFWFELPLMLEHN